MSPVRQGEDVPGISLELATYWIAVHQESLGILEEAMHRMRMLVAAGPVNQRRESELGDVALVAAEVVITRDRLNHWVARVGELSSAGRDHGRRGWLRPGASRTFSCWTGTRPSALS